MEHKKGKGSVSGFFLSRSARASEESIIDLNPPFPEHSGKISVKQSSSDDQIVHFGRRGELRAPSLKKEDSLGSQLKLLKEVNSRHPIRPPFVHKPGASRVLSWTQLIKSSQEKS